MSPVAPLPAGGQVLRQHPSALGRLLPARADPRDWRIAVVGDALTLSVRADAVCRTWSGRWSETKVIIEFGRLSGGGFSWAVKRRHRVDAERIREAWRTASFGMRINACRPRRRNRIEAERVIESRRAALTGSSTLERARNRLLERVGQIGRSWPSRLFLDLGGKEVVTADAYRPPRCLRQAFGNRLAGCCRCLGGWRLQVDMDDIVAKPQPHAALKARRLAGTERAVGVVYVQSAARRVGDEIAVSPARDLAMGARNEHVGIVDLPACVGAAADHQLALRPAGSAVPPGCVALAPASAAGSCRDPRHFRPPSDDRPQPHDRQHRPFRRAAQARRSGRAGPRRYAAAARLRAPARCAGRRRASPRPCRERPA
jgi:hypothetical protein